MSIRVYEQEYSEDLRAIQKPVKLIHPQDLEDRYQELEVKYGQFTQDELKKFESCPYFNIREMLASFMNDRNHDLHNEKSDLLAEKHQLDQQARHIDDQYQYQIRQYRKQKRRASKLEQVLNYYQTELEGVNYMMRVCVQKETRYKNIGRSVDFEFLTNFDQYFQDFSNINKEAKEVETKYFNLINFSEFFTQACNQIASRKRFTHEYEHKTMKQYHSDLNKIVINLNTMIRKTEQNRFRSRQKAKYNEILDQPKPDEINNFRQNYSMLIRFPNQIKNDIQKLRQPYQALTASYASYIKKCIEYEEVNLIRGNSEKYKHMINKEKNNFTHHLKHNHELMINYHPSNEFKSLNTLMKNKKYAEVMYAHELGAINAAIKFVNQDYGRMFKRICEPNGIVVKKEIEEFVKKFTAMPESQTYRVVILNTLAKLKQLCESS